MWTALDMHRLELLRSCSELGAIIPSDGSLWLALGSVRLTSGLGPSWCGSTSVSYGETMVSWRHRYNHYNDFLHLRRNTLTTLTQQRYNPQYDSTGKVIERKFRFSLQLREGEGHRSSLTVATCVPCFLLRSYLRAFSSSWYWELHPGPTNYCTRCCQK